MVFPRPLPLAPRAMMALAAGQGRRWREVPVSLPLEIVYVPPLPSHFWSPIVSRFFLFSPSSTARADRTPPEFPHIGLARWL